MASFKPLKVALIMGAGSGIGREVAIELAKRKYRVALAGRTESKLQETLELILKHFGESISDSNLLRHRFAIEPLDLQDPGMCRNTIERVHTRFGQIDALVNVAGYVSSKNITSITPDEWQTTIDTNLSYVIFSTNQVWPIFVKQKNGMIINVSSLASVDPFPGFAMYATAKIGVNMFTKCTAEEGREHNIKSVCIAPGAVETPMLRSLFDESMIPNEATLSPCDVAQKIAGLATEEHQFTSGETILLPSPEVSSTH